MHNISTTPRSGLVLATVPPARSAHHPDHCLPRLYTVQTHWTQQPACCASPTADYHSQLHGAGICLGPTSCRHTAHSLLNRCPEWNTKGKARPTNSIPTINKNLQCATLYDFKMLINIVYVFYSDCYYKQSHSIPQGISISISISISLSSSFLPSSFLFSIEHTTFAFTV